MKVEIRFPGLCRELTPAGNVRWRVRVEGENQRKITVPVGPEDSDFKKHYEAAREGKKLEVRCEDSSIRKGTLDELCSRFLLSMEAQVEAGNLSQLTLNSRRTGLTQACDCLSPKGHRMVSLNADLPKEAFAHIRDSFGARTGAAATCLKALRAAYAWGEVHGCPKESSVFEVKSEHVQKGGAIPWTQDDQGMFLSRHGPGTMARRWFFLARDTAGRIGDMHVLGPANERRVDGTLYIAWQPKKRGSQPVRVPVSDELKAELSLMQEDSQTYLVTERGYPFSSSGALDNRVRKWIIDAGLCEPVVDRNGRTVLKATRSQHGLRKARAVEIAEQGGSVYEVMSYLSHSDPKTSAIYTKQVERERLAEQAVTRLKGKKSVKSVPPQKNAGHLQM